MVDVRVVNMCHVLCILLSLHRGTEIQRMDILTMFTDILPLNMALAQK